LAPDIRRDCFLIANRPYLLNIPLKIPSLYVWGATMSGASYVLIVNLGMAVLLAVTFHVIARAGPAYRSANWLSFGYTVGSLAIATEILLPLGIFTLALYLAGFVFYLTAMGAGVIGLLRRSSVKVPYLLCLAYLTVFTALTAALYSMPREELPRQMAYQLPMATVLFVGGIMFLRHAPRQLADRLLGAIIIATGMQIGTKPFLATIMGGIGETPLAYIGTQYAAYSQAVGGILALALGLVCVLVYVRDMLSDARRKAETDILTGLLNWRGFRNHVTRRFEGDGGTWLPAAVLSADIDHFDTINGALGRSGGDEVIRDFARLMRKHSSGDRLLARTGGEEFALFIPEANFSSAWLAAETIRSHFAGLTFDGLPPDFHATASFGVAIRMEGESIEPMMMRANRALATSKHDGRNRITVAGTGENPAPRKAN
jgi:diguanylate cyclase (GGDEF)-like protein